MTANSVSHNKPIEGRLYFEDPLLTPFLKEIGLTPHHLLNPHHLFKSSDSYLTAKDCANNRLSYDFFKAFARLNQVASIASPGTGSETGSSSIPEDSKIDSSEALLLRQALTLLSHPFLEGVNLDPLERKSLENIFLLKNRINLLGRDPCWLGDDAIKIGLFGATNGSRPPMVEMVVKPNGEFERKSTSSPAYFDCQYSEELSQLMPGLSFEPESMPDPIQQAAKSTVSLEVVGRDGVMAGFVYGKPGYILTSRHLLNDVMLNTDHQVSLKISDGTVSTTVLADVIDVNIPTGAMSPGLVLLYVGDKELASTIPLRPHKREVGDQNTRVFAIGYPVQNGKVEQVEKLITPGDLQVERNSESKEGSLVSNIPSLPGDSGGPVVDSEGNVVAVMASLIPGTFLAKPDPTASAPSTEVAPITGSGMYPMALWDANIQAAIAAHEKLVPH